MFIVEPFTEPLVLWFDVTLCSTDPVEDACDVCDARLCSASALGSKLPFASASESDRILKEGAAISFAWPAVLSLG